MVRWKMIKKCDKLILQVDPWKIDRSLHLFHPIFSCFQVTYNFNALSVPEELRQRHVSSLAKELQVAEKLQVQGHISGKVMGIQRDST
jgi:hypothetical protein